MDYPHEFSPQARNSVEAERIKAYQDFEKAKAAARWDSDVEELLRQCVLRVLLAFAREACAISKSGSLGWSIDKIDRVCQEFWRRMTLRAWYDKGFGIHGGRFRHVASNLTGDIDDRTTRAFEAMAEWQEYQNVLLEVADDDGKDSAAPRSEPGLKTDAAAAGPTVEETVCRSEYNSEAQRIEILAAYCHRFQCSEAALARTASVHPADLSKWKKGSLSPGSDKNVRIERVLQSQEAPTPASKRDREF